LFLRNSSTILLAYANPIRHHTFQAEFWLEELDIMMCVDARACDQVCKQFCKAHGLTYKLTNHKPDCFDERSYSLLLDSDDVKAAILSNSEIDGLKL